MQTLAEIRAILHEHGLAPRRSLGQNFLIDQNLVRKLVDASGVGEGDLVLEVGPGTGTLTEALLERGALVVASELDAGLAAMLRDRFAATGQGRFRLIEGDCLASKRALAPAIVEALDEGPFRLVANLPYGCATPLMLTLLADQPACAGQYVTIQREVADRLQAPPGTRAYGTISAVARSLADIRLIASLPPACFWPRPDVESAMVAIERRPGPEWSDTPADWRSFAELVQRLFTQRRRQIGGVLRRMLGPDSELPPAIDPQTRVEGLSPDELVVLWQALHRSSGS